MPLRRRTTGPTIRLSPEGSSDTNGGDRINAHVSGRFLRAFCCPDARIAAVIPTVLILFGLAALALGAVILRTFGPGYRVGRFLAATRSVSVADAVAMATSGGPAQYVKITGRIDSETDFEDAAHRPLVFRRTRIDAKAGRKWRSIDDVREAVPFEVNEGLESVGIHHEDLDEGLVVLPRQSVGTAADAPEWMSSDWDPATVVRLLVQQVSNVEHAIVAGVPTLDPAGKPMLAAGLGKPLILTTLATDEAMRVLAGEHPRRPLVVAISLVVGVVFVSVGLVWAIVDTVL